MNEATQDILQNVLGDEFKIAVEKQDKILNALDLQSQKLQDTINVRTKELEVLDKKKAGLEDAIILAYHDKDEALKTAQDNFEKSKSNSISSLEAREKRLEDLEKSHESNIKKNTDYLNLFNKEKLEFANRKKSIVETLEESLKMHTELLGDAINALKEPYQESVSSKEDSKNESTSTIL